MEMYKSSSRFRHAAVLVFLGLLPAPLLLGQQSPSQKGSAQLQASSKGASQSGATADPNYVIGPQDIIDISVWKEPDLISIRSSPPGR